jgi:hypothetical protein
MKSMNQKKHIFTLLIFIWSATSFSQWGYKSEDVAHRFKPGFMWFYTGLRPAEVEKPRKYDRLVVDVLYNSWMNDGKFVKQDVGRSIGFNTNLMWDIPLNKYNGVGLGIGFQHRYQRTSPTSAVIYDPISKTTDYNEAWQPSTPYNVFQSHVFALPIELRFRQKKWKQMKINMGGSIGYRPFMRRKSWSLNKETIFIDRRLQDINPLDYQAHIRFGFRAFALYASYGFSPQFKSKESVKFTTASAGISISLF